jgi:PE family
MAAAATDLANIGSTITAANAAAAGPTTELMAAAADEISTAVSSLFSQHAQAFQALSAEAAAFHQQLVQTLTAAADSYAGVEAAGASLLRAAQQDGLALVTAPARTLSAQAVGLNKLLTADVTNLELGAHLNLGRLANVPYNVFADIVNIPYYESLALQEYAYALGPAGSVGGVPGWIPPGATLANGGVKMVNGLPYYALGGTGSWFMESIGNTWGWDDGNWPQLDGLLHFFLPFKFTESLAEQLQILAQAEIIDGAAVNSEFETANPLAYVGGWFHTPLSQLLSGYTYPPVLANTIGQNSPTGVINVGPNPPGGNLVIWSGQHVTLNPMAPLEAIGANLTGSPADNPIMLPNPAGVIQNVVKLSNDLNYLEFNPFVQGSFLYWGAPTLYSVPAALGGIVQQFTGIPNQFLIPPWQPYGAEPITGYTAGLPELVEGLPRGFDYLAKGLLGYMNPALPVDLSGPLDALGNLGVWPADMLRASGVANLWTLLTTNLPRAIADFDTQVGNGLASILSCLTPGIGTDSPIVLYPT